MAGQSQAQWRLLDTGPADGFTNMAVDEALLESLAAEQGPPTLRFYSWSPPALSLGYGQSSQARSISTSVPPSASMWCGGRPADGRFYMIMRSPTAW